MYGLEGPLVNRYAAVNHYQKYEKKWKRYLEALKKKNNIIFSMAKLLGSHLELKKINKIHAKESKKYDYSISDSYRIDSYSSISSDSE